MTPSSKKELPAQLEKHFKTLPLEEFSARLRRLLTNDKLSDGDKAVMREWAASKGIALD